MQNNFFSELSKQIIQLSLQHEKIFEEIHQKEQFFHLLHISTDNLALLYSKALKMFQEERFQDAMDAFLFLVFLDSTKHDLWLGLGMSLQMCKRYETAIIAYELAAICETENPTAYFYLAKCLFAIHDHASALEAIEVTINYAKDKEEYREILDQAQSARLSLMRRQ